MFKRVFCVCSKMSLLLFVIWAYGDDGDAGTVCNVSSTAKFHDALMKHQEAAQRHLDLAKEEDVYCSTSDDDDDDDDADDKDVFKTLVESFNMPSGAICWFLQMYFE